MSLLIEKKKKKKNLTEDLSEYHKDYRIKNREHLRRLERVHYYKTHHNLDDEFIKLFGEFSADVYRIQKDFKLIEENCPEIIPHILNLINKN